MTDTTNGHPDRILPPTPERPTARCGSCGAEIIGCRFFSTIWREWMTYWVTRDGGRDVCRVRGEGHWPAP